jgi:hypothetical protein
MMGHTEASERIPKPAGQSTSGSRFSRSEAHRIMDRLWLFGGRDNEDDAVTFLGVAVGHDAMSGRVSNLRF